MRSEGEVNAGVSLRVKGKVQGVGFRPFVWQLARRLNLRGEVSNDGAGVIIHLQQTAKLDEFLRLLTLECPPLARIDSLTSQQFHWSQPPADFTIAHSGGGQPDTHIVADAATCDACLEELHNPHNRRFQYPFTNCTHCGPRFSIIRQLPYDRHNTSMDRFPLCPACLAEYQNPGDRRFHAQPNACPVCGPQIWLSDRDDRIIARAAHALCLAGEALKSGDIVAVKGIGGFHLVCDATNPTAVQRLRRRKQRPTKPVAVMVPDVQWLEKCAHIVDQARLLAVLKGPAAPIVLVPKRAESPLCQEIAPGLHEVGVMLPANPLQHLLMQQVGRPLVMTSANFPGEPPALTNAQAQAMTGEIADYCLLHDREIIQRADDSLLRLHRQQSEMLRRGRGYVPDALALPAGFSKLPTVLALGADLKNMFCLLWQEQAVPGPHLGDLDNDEVRRQQRQLLTLFCQIYALTPQMIAVDAHPGYVSRTLGIALAREWHIPWVETLHHHAHLASCLGEHGWPREGGKVIGLVLDGLGYGQDGQLWGGECLLMDYQQIVHLGGLPAVALSGGDLASRQPWRNLFAHLQTFVPEWQTRPEAAAITPTQATVLSRAIVQRVNTPLASSTGRLFDAVAAALQIAPPHLSWEGEAACLLEALAWQSPRHIPPVSLPLRGNMLDIATFWQEWLAYRAPTAQRAYAFHYALAQGFAALARKAAEDYGIGTVALSGGVLHNALLKTLLLEHLDGLQILLPSQLPAGDGGLAFGQGLIAAALLSDR